MKAVVIGAGYGDEGKGMMTEWLVRKCYARPAVVRFNGGAQAGHTVNWIDAQGNEQSNVFHHLGSGTLRGSPTILSRHFISNPTLFLLEVENLHKRFGKVAIEVYVDNRSLLTTPYDVYINQAIERKRGDERHGSCGVGINETMLRSKTRKYQLTVGDLGKARLSKTLADIRTEYFPARCADLGLEIDEELLKEASLRFIEDSDKFKTMVHVAADTDAIKSFENVIFEGAQGLLLDKFAPGFPHVTNSNTGIKNVLELVSPGDLLDIYYVSRTYLTRHGAGPLKRCMPKVPSINDPTNVPNDYQGTIRYGDIDLDLLSIVGPRETSILENSGVESRTNLVLTHADVYSVSPYTQGAMSRYLGATGLFKVYDKFANRVTEIL